MQDTDPSAGAACAATVSPRSRDAWKIPCLVPDLPSADELLSYLRDIDDNRWYTNFGPLQCCFETAMAAFVAPGRPQVIAAAFSSATLALELTLRALGLEPGARVLLPALTFPATLLAVMRAGLTPVLGDVDPATWALDPQAVEADAAKTRIDAVLPVAPFGYPVPMAPWVGFRARTGIPVLADTAGALGSQVTDGTLPMVFSLHATKPLSAGEGGVLVSADAPLVASARALSNFGFSNGQIIAAGTNAKFSEYHAAVGLAQLARAECVLEKRRQVLAWYRSLLPASLLRPLPAGDDPASCPAMLPVHTGARADQVAAQLARAGIETRRWYYPPLHQHAAFRGVARNATGTLTVTEALAQGLVGIPFHSHLREADIRFVASHLLAALREAA